MRRRHVVAVLLAAAALALYVFNPRGGRTAAGAPATVAAQPAAGAPRPQPAGARETAAAHATGHENAPAANTPFARPVEVTAAGWVRVPLDLATLRHVGVLSSVRINGPGGEEVTHWTAPFIADSERRPVKVQEVHQEPQGWTLRLDVGAEPITHERLLLDFTHLATVPDVTLDASDDGQHWRPLVAGDLFRLGQSEELARTSLVYPATQARYLRLSWPRQAGFPELRDVLVEPTTPGRSLTITSPNNPCQDGSTAGTLICRLPLPASGQTARRLTVELAGGNTIGYRLYEPRQARWAPLAAGVWRGAGTRHVVPLAGQPLGADSLRLDLFGGAAEPRPRLLSHSFDLAVETVLFYAEAPGRYTLSYGGAPGAEAGATAPPEGRAIAAGVEAAWIVPGAEDEGHLGPLPSAAAPGAKLPADHFRASWVVTSAAAPGDLVRLPLPDVVYEQARPDLGDLRLIAAGKRQIPYVRWAPPDPVPVLDRPDQRPEAEKGRRYSHIEVPLPAGHLPITEIDLSVAPSPLRRPVGVRYPDSGPPALAMREERLVARASWECLPEPPLPCRLGLPVNGPAPRHMTIRFADGDNPPLASVNLRAWRRGDVLLFAWPAAREGVQLLAGVPELAPPVYDLDALSDVLPSRPWQPAALDLTGEQRQGEAPWWNRWVLPALLGFAGVALLLLLRKILVEP